jgi:hypothetical protein
MEKLPEVATDRYATNATNATFKPGQLTGGFVRLAAISLAGVGYAGRDGVTPTAETYA